MGRNVHTKASKHHHRDHFHIINNLFSVILYSSQEKYLMNHKVIACTYNRMLITTVMTVCINGRLGSIIYNYKTDKQGVVAIHPNTLSRTGCGHTRLASVLVNNGILIIWFYQGLLRNQEFHSFQVLYRSFVKKYQISTHSPLLLQFPAKI